MTMPDLIYAELDAENKDISVGTWYGHNELGSCAEYHHDRIVTALKAENERLRVALQFYADKDEYDFDGEVCYERGKVINDEGEVARKALADKGE